MKHYSTEERAALCDAVLEGMAVRGLSCIKACKAAGVPNGTFMGWLDEDAALAERYARARDIMLEHVAEDLMDKADEFAADAVAVQKQRLQVDARKWLLSKLAPKKYGDAVTHRGDSENPLGPIVQITATDAKL